MEFPRMTDVRDDLAKPILEIGLFGAIALLITGDLIADWRSGTDAVKRLIRCAAEHHGLSPHTALSIAYRESRYQPRAYNAWSCAKGIYQHLCRYWTLRAAEYGFSERSPYNARVNIFVTMRMVERYGWAPWGG